MAPWKNGFIKKLQSTANLNFLFLSVFVYLLKNCSSQFFSNLKSAEPVFCSQELSCLPSKNQNKGLTPSFGEGKFIYAALWDFLIKPFFHWATFTKYLFTSADTLCYISLGRCCFVLETRVIIKILTHSCYLINVDWFSLKWSKIKIQKKIQKKIQNGRLKTTKFFKTVNSQYFLAKLSGIDPCVSRINWCEGHQCNDYPGFQPMRSWANTYDRTVCLRNIHIYIRVEGGQKIAIFALFLY